MMHLNDPAWVAVYITAAVAVGGFTVRYVVVPGCRLLKWLFEFLEDWRGEDARPGHARQPGTPERLSMIEAELKPNHGGSLRDAMDRVERHLAAHINDPNAHRGGST